MRNKLTRLWWIAGVSWAILAISIAITIFLYSPIPIVIATVLVNVIRRYFDVSYEDPPVLRAIALSFLLLAVLLMIALSVLKIDFEAFQLWVFGTIGIGFLVAICGEIAYVRSLREEAGEQS